MCRWSAAASLVKDQTRGLCADLPPHMRCVPVIAQLGFLDMCLCKISAQHCSLAGWCTVGSLRCLTVAQVLSRHVACVAWRVDGSARLTGFFANCSVVCCGFFHEEHAQAGQLAIVSFGVQSLGCAVHKWLSIGETDALVAWDGIGSGGSAISMMVGRGMCPGHESSTSCFLG